MAVTTYRYLLIVVTLSLCFPSFSHADTCAWPDTALRAGEHWYDRGQYLMGSLLFAQVAESHCDRALKMKGLYGVSLSFWKLGEMPAFEETVSQGIRTGHGPFLEKFRLLDSFANRKIDTRLSQLHQQKLNLWTHRHQFEQFRKILDKMNSVDAEKKKLDIIDKNLTGVHLLKPWVAGGFSALVPGLGQAYAGSFQSAAFSLALNALFLSATIELNRHGLKSTAFAAGAVFSVTYIGNILSGIKAARSYNQHVLSPYELKLQQTLFPEFQP